MAQRDPAASTLPWLALAALVILLDQATKILIVRSLQLGDSVFVWPWFNIVRAHNLGAAFSFLHTAGGWQRWLFVGLGAVAAVVIVVLLRRHRGQHLLCTAMALILGGALGNVVDRLWHGYVVDFLQVHHAGWYFPAFNVADSAITLGAALRIYDELQRMRRGGA